MYKDYFYYFIFFFKTLLADIISILAMTVSEERECLKFHLFGSNDALESWGHEYVRYIFH